jgi:hypothetical protein
MNWAARQRQAFIDQWLNAVGHIGRAALMGEFGISAAQASMDLRAFLEANPGRMTYDKSRKRYVAAPAKSGDP